MKRKTYKPIRRSQKRVYTHSVKKKNRSKRLFLFFLILFVLGLIFVPGHNGLIKLAAKQLWIRKLHGEIENLKMRIELVRAKVAQASDPEFIKRYAHDRYGMIPKQDTLK
jgi:cell division protein FtsB